MNDILTQIWGCLVQSSQIYLNKVVNSDTNDADNDNEGIKQYLNLLYLVCIITMSIKI